MGLVLQGSLLVRHAPTYVSDAFLAARLGDADHPGPAGLAMGTLPPGLDTQAIVTRATPVS